MLGSKATMETSSTLEQIVPSTAKKKFFFCLTVYLAKILTAKLRLEVDLIKITEISFVERENK